VGQRNESFPRNICSRGLSYVPSRLDGSARKTVYEMSKTLFTRSVTRVSVVRLLEQTRINKENRGMRLGIPSFFLVAVFDWLSRSTQPFIVCKLLVVL